MTDHVLLDFFGILNGLCPKNRRLSQTLSVTQISEIPFSVHCFALYMTLLENFTWLKVSRFLSTLYTVYTVYTASSASLASVQSADSGLNNNIDNLEEV